MGVTGAIFNGLTFDGESSKDYGVYITGQAVYNSPERDVEMISIPGRDGAFALDRGRFSNIEVTYPAGLFGVDHADFAQAISDFRNMLGSRVGYCRLEDDYNPGEYREAVFKAGVEVTPASLESGQFDIVFECKPQRWLTSGEDAVAVTSGGTITNPTLFESLPLLQVTGYGDIDLGGEVITVNSSTLGIVDVVDEVIRTQNTITVKLKSGFLNNGDYITFPKISMNTPTTIEPGSGISITSSSGVPAAIHSQYQYNEGTDVIGFINAKFQYGTASSQTANVTCTYNLSDGTTQTQTKSVRIGYSNINELVFSVFSIGSVSSPLVNGAASIRDYVPIIANSSVSINDHNIDLDLGEAYAVLGSEIVSDNGNVYIPAQLPTLPPGASTITYDNTITQFKVVPRWWQL